MNYAIRIDGYRFEVVENVDMHELAWGVILDPREFDSYKLAKYHALLLEYKIFKKKKLKKKADKIFQNYPELFL